MLSKTITLLAIFALNCVQSDFYCVNGLDVCPATTQPGGRYCSYCGKPLYMSIIESRIADQLPFHFHEDSSDDGLDHFHLRTFSDQLKEAKEKNMTNDISNIATKGVRKIEDLVDPSSEEPIVGDISKMTLQSHTDVPIKYVPDVSATSQPQATFVNPSNSELDSPPYIADVLEREIPGFPIEADATKNVVSSPNIDKTRQPDIKMENLEDVNISLQSLSNPLETTTTSQSNNIKKQETKSKRTKKRKNKKPKKISDKVDESEISKMFNEMLDMLDA